MKRTMIYKDDHGKEAFAYLAVMLMVLSTLFISYQVYLQKEDEKRGSKTAKITMISSFMEEDRTMVRMELFSLHDQLLIDCETEIVKEITTTSVDGNLETKLSALMEMELEKILNGSRTKREGYTISILNCSADTTPISIDLDGPVPSTGHDNTSGLVDRTMKPSCTGVNTTFNIVLKINDDAGTIEMIERMEFTRETLTLLPMLEGRMERFEMGIESTELPELFNYIVGSLAQMKCLMGYGRVAYGTITPLISEGEIISCADLALALMASSHLHGEDSEFLGGIDEGLGSAPGAGGKRLDMGDLFRNHSGQLDPSMAVIMGEGLFSEGNAPGLDMMLRPLLGTLVDGILLRMIDYMGMGDWFYTMAGGLAQVFEIGSEIVNSVTKSLLGIELLESNDRSAEDILEEVISSSGIFPNDDAFIMNREVQGVTWNDLPVVHYPMIQVPNLTRSSELYLYEDDPSNEFYIGKDGKAHSRAEYYDPEEELLGWNCTVHTLDIDFNFHEMEPAFNGIPLDDEEVFRSLALYLGTIATDDDSAEDIMMEKGKMAVRNGVEMAVDLISAPGSGIWERSWKGWNMSTMPDIEGEELPISEMVSFQLDPMKAIVDVLSGSILENLDLVGFLSFLEDTGASYRTATASFLHDRYDSISGKSDQILSCMDNITETILPNSSWTLTDHSILEENVIIKDHCIAVADPSSLDVLDTYPEIPQSLCLGIDENGIEDPELYTIWTEGIGSSYDETFRRELGKGGDGSDPGFMWEAFTSPDARGGGKSIISADLNLGNLSSMINELMVTALYAVEQMFYLPLNTTSGRFLCSLPDEKNVFRTPGSDIREIEIDLSIDRSATTTGSLRPSNGTYYTDPHDSAVPYSSHYNVELKAEYLISYGGTATEKELNDTIMRIIDIDVTADIEVVSMWPMSGIDYQQKGSFIERLADQILEAKNVIVEKLGDIGKAVLGDTMSSLREVPPLIMDLIEGKELDLAEISRVISNITMDASSTIREGVKGAINRIVDMGISGAMDLVLSLLGIDEINVSFDLGPFNIRIYSELEALQGGSGTILALDLRFDPIGMFSHLSFSRVDNETLDFNGTLVFDIGPLYLRAEMDPFMMRAPHMISIEGRFDIENGDPIRFSLKCPALDEYRSCEVSLGESLGFEPFVPIPILGINAVLNAGFRLRYRMPTELTPHLNEVNFRSGTLTSVEIYNPREWPLYASTIEVEDLEGNSITSWRLEELDGSISFIDISSMDPWTGEPDTTEGTRIVLRDPSGIVMDDVEVNEVRNGWFSRDRDGFGVWRWGDGSPGALNSPLPLGDIKTILISIAISSLKEAWEISYDEYGLSFDIVVPFLELALDLFMERFLAVVRELVIDVMMFLDILITDSSGTAGSGMELFFSADGEAVADFFQWLYDNVKTFISKLADPSGAGDYTSFPWEILHRCRVGLMLFSEVELPISISSMAPPGVTLPDSFRIAVQGSFSISFPMLLLGMDVDGFSISFGVYIMEAPGELVSLFYDVTSTSMTSDLWLLKAEIWQGE